MPPRGFVIAVVVFWLGTTSALFVRDILPRWRAGGAPRYAIELTDDVAAPQVVWEVFQKDKKIGRGVSQIRRQPDRTFEMSQQFHFDDLRTSVLGTSLAVRKLDTTYRVTREGRLLGIKLAGHAALDDDGPFGRLQASAELEGEVKDGVLTPKLRVFGAPASLGSFGSIPVDEHGSVLNPMHLLHRLPGLQEGQRWQVPLFDPMKMFSEKFFSAGAPFLEAEVTVDTFDWNTPKVECFRIGYREPGKDEVAQTWVRRADGMVLAQRAKQHGHEFLIRRLPESHDRP